MDDIPDLKDKTYTDLLRMNKNKELHLMKIPWASCPRQDALYGSDDIIGAAKCQPCPDGYYCPNEATIYPIQCPLGSYQAGLAGASEYNFFGFESVMICSSKSQLAPSKNKP